MKILFYNHTGKVSGAEHMILLVLRRLNRRRFAPLMICPATGTLAQTVTALDVPCRTITQLEARFTVRPDELTRYFVSFVQTLRQLRTEIKNAQPDLIHANSIRSGLTATAASVGGKIPVIWHLQDELPPHPLSSLIRLFAALSPRTRLMPASKATGDIFRGRLLRLFGKHFQERVVHNAVELKDFQIDESNRGRIRRELNLSDDEFVIGIIGQITPRKGQLELIETFAELQKQMPSSTLVVVGAPMFNQDYLYLEKLKETAPKLGIETRVKFLGSRSDVAAIMQSLDVLIINSRSEALVVVAIEAMACGTPIIATDVGGTAEIITHLQNGWLVPFGDKQALSEAIIAFSREPEMRRKFTVESQRFVRANLSAEQFIKKVEIYYQTCVQSAPEATAERLAVEN